MMTPHVPLLLLALFGIGLAGSAAARDALPPRNEGALRRWLVAGTFRATYTPEPSAHLSTGPHGQLVRTWYSPRLVADLRAGRPQFRRGVAMVKELLLLGPDAPPAGFSVMRKVQRRSAAGAGWLFYETFDVESSRAFFGRGLSLCAGCHAAGMDYLQSTFRP